MRKILQWILLPVAALYLVACAGLYLAQTRFIFVPQREVEHTPLEFGCGFQQVRIPGSGGETLEGWWLPADPRLSARTGSRTVIYFHGNGGSIGANAEHACRLRGMGLNVLLFDYRGYGQSQGGPPTENTVYQDADSAWDYLLHQRNVDAYRVVIYGHSLGGAVAIEMAKRHPEAAALIAESTFTSIRDMAARDRNFSYFPLSLILDQHMDSLAKIESIHMPALLIHGTADRVIPPEMSRRLYAAAPGPKQLFLVPGAGHDNCAATAGPLYQQTVLDFLNNHSSRSAAAHQE